MDGARQVRRRVTEAFDEIRLSFADAQTQAVLVASTLAALFVLLTVEHFGDTLLWFQYDDAYVTYRHAARLATGHGWSFNDYEAINSASSWLFTVILAAAYFVGLTDLEAVGGALGLAGGATAVAITFLACWRASGRNLLVGAAATLPLVLSGSLGLWATSGMETTVFAALAVGALAAYAWKIGPSWLRASLLVALVLVRVEGIAVVLAVGLVETHLSGARAGLRLAGPAVLALTAFLLWNKVAFGEWLPHPAAWKDTARYYSGTPLSRRWDVHDFVEPMKPLLWSVVAWAALAVARDPARRSRFDAVPVALVAGAALLLVSPRSDAERYAVHFLPLLMVVAAAAWAGILGLATTHREVGRPIAVFAVLGLALTASWGALESMDGSIRFHDSFPAHQVARRAAGEWILANTPHDALIASSDIGMIAYVALDRDFVDTLGLTTRGFPAAPYETSLDRLRALRPTFVADSAYATGHEGEAPMPAALGIVSNPAHYYNGVQRSEGLNLEDALARTQVATFTGGSLTVSIEELRWHG